MKEKEKTQTEQLERRNNWNECFNSADRFQEKRKIVALCKEITVASYRYDNGFIVSDAYKIDGDLFQSFSVAGLEVRRRCTRFT
jgi:hypothetical protein